MITPRAILVGEDPNSNLHTSAYKSCTHESVGLKSSFKITKVSIANNSIDSIYIKKNGQLQA